MKLLTLNIWGGHVKDPLLEFIKSHQEIDIFCLQEVYHNAPHKISCDDRPVSLKIFSDIQEILPSHKGFFSPVVESFYGIGMFFKNNINIDAKGRIEIHNNPTYAGLGPTHSRDLQWIKCQSQNKEYTILNVHGLWNGLGKTDSPERIHQSHKIRQFMDTITTPKILCGDFNLRPDTESLKILEEGMANLIQGYDIKSTRTRLYDKEEKFADYIFTSPDIILNSFRVLQDEVSDHAPLFLDFD